MNERKGRKLKETPADEAVRDAVLENAGARLLQIVGGLEDLADRIGELRADVKTRLDAAKSEGYSVGAIRALLKKRAATAEAIKAQEELFAQVDIYEQALKVAENA